jgi:hypothetical protein
MSSKVAGIVDKVSGPTCRSVGLLAGWVHLTGTSGTLVDGDPWVPMSHMHFYKYRLLLLPKMVLLLARLCSLVVVIIVVKILVLRFWLCPIYLLISCFLHIARSCLSIQFNPMCSVPASCSSSCIALSCVGHLLVTHCSQGEWLSKSVRLLASTHTHNCVFLSFLQKALTNLIGAVCYGFSLCLFQMRWVLPKCILCSFHGHISAVQHLVSTD